MKKIHLDTDLGSDPEDVCALAYLLARDDVEITGITTNHEVEGRRAGYVHEVLRLAGRNGIPVAAGAEGGLMGIRMSGRLPEESSFWPEPVSPRPSRAGEALDLIDASVEQGATVVGIGIHTNLAVYDTLRPGRLARSRLVIMGGHIPPIPEGLPQWGREKDWNMYMDGAAARSVMERCDPTMVMKNVIFRVHLRARDLPQLRRGGPLGELIARQAEARDRLRGARKIGQAHALLPDDLLNFLPDSLTCAVALGWDGVTRERLPLRIDDDGGGPVEHIDPRGILLIVVTDVDTDRFNKHWLDTVAPAAADTRHGPIDLGIHRAS